MRLKRLKAFHFLPFCIVVALLVAALVHLEPYAGEDERLTPRQKRGITAAVITQYPATIRKSVLHIVTTYDGNDKIVSFENPKVSGYANPLCQTDSCRVFGTGANQSGFVTATNSIDWRDQSQRHQSHYGEWIFTGDVCIAGIGDGADDCARDGRDNEELLAVLPWVRRDLCEAINAEIKLLDGKPDIPLADSNLKIQEIRPFTGSYREGLQLRGAGRDHASFDGTTLGCFATEDQPHKRAYHFYRILLER